ncbi:long-chain-fatty-acid--[acyl-carrier-protein] ligase AEE15, chloroplastic-like [Cajanus cajan]|nr:long-chain-fatty-acid--[acyl-carrier-protein] ligase AEE15, chloroplastic-like [Cajanus cajan]
MMASGAINVVRGSRSSVEELLQIYNHSESVALVVDNPEMFNRVANTFYSRTSMRFVVLLWGEKSDLVGQENKHVPVFTFMEVINLGRESRQALSNTHDAGKYQALTKN